MEGEQQGRGVRGLVALRHEQAQLGFLDLRADLEPHALGGLAGGELPEAPERAHRREQLFDPVGAPSRELGRGLLATAGQVDHAFQLERELARRLQREPNQRGGEGHGALLSRRAGAVAQRARDQRTTTGGPPSATSICAGSTWTSAE
jgi:hypothetical protein